MAAKSTMVSKIMKAHFASKDILDEQVGKEMFLRRTKSLQSASKRDIEWTYRDNYVLYLCQVLHDYALGLADEPEMRGELLTCQE